MRRRIGISTKIRSAPKTRQMAENTIALEKRFAMPSAIQRIIARMPVL